MPELDDNVETIALCLFRDFALSMNRPELCTYYRNPLYSNVVLEMALVHTSPWVLCLNCRARAGFQAAMITVLIGPSY